MNINIKQKRVIKIVMLLIIIMTFIMPVTHKVSWNIFSLVDFDTYYAPFYLISSSNIDYNRLYFQYSVVLLLTTGLIVLYNDGKTNDD